MQTVRTLMTNQVLTVPTTATPSEVVSMLTAHDVSALAVVDEYDVVIGVLTRSDVLEALTWQDERPRGRLPWQRRGQPGAGWARTTARELMTAPPVTVAPGSTAEEAARVMAAAGVKRLLVTDHRRHLVGLIAATDLLPVLAAGSRVPA